LHTYPLATKQLQGLGIGAVNNKLESYIMKKFIKDESGATAIEYGLIAAAMAVCLLTAMPYITAALVTKFNNIGSALK
jgi:pilus assembly protein Flp/PilA